MANDFGDFQRRITILARNIETQVDALVRKTALAVDQTLVMSTPVDTGRARSNWVVQIGSAPDGEIDAYAPGEKGTTGAENTQAAINQAEAAISRYSGGAGEIHITNNLPYIQRLNDGYSHQAPAGFVEEAISLAVRAVVRSTRIT